ncbi:somatostatin receptor type 2 [Nematostella vectensis]|uniref:somatostatin receptor type 2 n=1 Tax=Nematostella vectensis TaxID=45351 RepID=UPI002077279E|nr:somatostatin receptor type 2 [Nematostella vectensis]XP_032235008.2 somatostatin receptor type 2 [Nematostella vectensis]XP_032235009.2 somatostatin receptor type 2 [Nematostella vectensis]XP_032235010.2 somatostatin receptor type 2 [Nematostella vectensis]XP_032235011.2 somatostatin receptor type 2 [Nematostella vectensis]XP_032235012.2 somatostatin receptor type 2 [Nematostella vectensis]XP_032235013.2 somatostatin receptor type 2 [Nematostella vectensis]XP_032235016.2 somatostatin rece
MNITNATARAILSKPTTESPSAANTTGTDLSILNTSTTSALNSTDASSILKDHTPLIMQLFLVSLVFLLAVIGNAGIWVLLKRFRSLRTVPNILVGNLALIDFLNATVNLPVFTAAGVLQLGHMGGRLASATIFAGQTLVIFLHLLSMLLMMVDRYIAIAWGLHYRIWKSQRKVLVAVIVVWTIVFGVTVPWVLLLYAVNKGNSPYLIYHIAYFHAVGKYNCFVTYPILGCTIGAVSALTYQSIRKQGKFFAETSVMQKGKTLLDESRQRNEVRAAQTVAITVVLYGVCLIPCLMYCSLMATPKHLPRDTGEEWFVFFVVISFYIPSALCPYIYVMRTSRFRRAITLLMQDPCGDSDLREAYGSSTTKETSASQRVEFSRKKKGSYTDAIPSSTHDNDGMTSPCREAESPPSADPDVIIVAIDEMEGRPDRKQDGKDNKAYKTEDGEYQQKDQNI